MAEDDVEGWRKILTRFKDSKVELGTRKLYSNLAKSKQVLINIYNYYNIINYAVDS